MLKTSSIETTCMSCFSELKPGNAFCTECGYNESAQVQAPHLLRPRTILNGKYLLGKVLGEGGFGITYIGWDLNLDIKVAIKEFYPTGFVTRETTSTTTVTPFTGSQGDFFHKSREKFVDEAKTLAKFRSLPGIVTVNDFFIENNTAYIVMEYIEGETLKGYLAKRGGKLPAEQLFEMMKPVMVSLNEVHKKGLIHRDISPDNIMITPEGYVKLLDFGAAREFADSGNKSLSIMLKPGFAPEEQYRSKGKQGPWTDVYALSATMYRILTGVTPDESANRVHEDEVVPPSKLGIAINPSQEAALMKGMAVLQKDRWQSVGELYDALYTVIPTQVASPQSIPKSEPKPVVELKPIIEPKTAPESKPITEPEPINVPKSVAVTLPVKAKKPNKALFAIAGIAIIVIVAVMIALSGGNKDNVSAYDDDEIQTESQKKAISAEVGDIIQFGGYDWRILKVDGNKAFILSDKILEYRSFDENEGSSITWPDSTIRSYLNNGFYNSFSSDERNAITKNTETDDYVFLLSADEVRTYLPDAVAYDSEGKTGYWWLRSHKDYFTAYVLDSGSIFGDGAGFGKQSNRFEFGIRPAMWIMLS